MIDSIGNSDLGFAVFIKLDGFPDIPGLKYDDISRPGMDGKAYRQMGSKGEPFTLRSIVDVVGNANFVSTANAYKAMQQSGELVSILYQDGSIEYDGYLILDVKTPESPVACLGVGGVNAGNRLLIASWTLVYAGYT